MGYNSVTAAYTFCLRGIGILHTEQVSDAELPEKEQLMQLSPELQLRVEELSLIHI